MYLNGTGQVDVSIGTNPWQDDVLTPITINVYGMGWYNISFPAIMLQQAIGNYYLNVWIANANYNNIGWGFINDSTVNTPTMQMNDYGSLSANTLQFPYNYYTNDYYHPALYSVGFNSLPPAIAGPVSAINEPINSLTKISWNVISSVDSYGTNSYMILRNGTNIGMGSWNSNTNVTMINMESQPGTFNYTLEAMDGLGGYATQTVWVTVTGSVPVSTVTTTVTSGPTTITVPTTVTATVTTTVTNSTVSTVSGSSGTTTATTTVTSTKSAPGFEAIATFLGLALAVTYFLRKRSKK